MTHCGPRFSWHLLLPALAIAVLLSVPTGAQSPASSEVWETTEDRVAPAGWWPTKGTVERQDLVGTSECAKCHSTEAATQRDTPMAHASAPAAGAEILREHDRLSLERAPYAYEITRGDGGSSYSVRQGSDAISEQLAWAFGVAHKGQTYIYQRKGLFYESRLSFYKSLPGLDLTTGHSSATPDDIEAALGRRLADDEAHRCFGCHTSGSTLAGKFDPADATPGVTCEQCHGPGAKHVAAMKAGKIEEGRRAVLNPSHLNPVASVDFCGACHRTWADVLQAGTTGVANVRFQPYRLENSRCWRQGDARLACIACHNPHQQLVREAASYDQKCLACHAAAKGGREKGGELNVGESQHHPESACPVSKQNCVSCHMPQIEIPSMHATFTDHRIRIVKANAPYPN
jgi:hypothetical protein